jgi:hypothetical protein
MIDIKNIEPSKYKLNQVVFYPFSNESVVVGRITDIDLSIAFNSISYSYGLITNGGKVYRAYETNLFNSYDLAFQSLKIDLLKNIDSLQISVDKLNRITPRLEQQILNFKDVTITASIELFGQSVKYFNKNDTVFVVPHSYENDTFCLEAVIVGIKGNIGTQNPNKNGLSYFVDFNSSLHLGLDIDLASSCPPQRYSERDVFNSKCDALSHCLHTMLCDIDKKNYKIKNIKQIISHNSQL